MAIATPPAPLPTPSTPVPPTAQRAPERRKWTVDEFERAIDAGVFGPEERLELIDGEIIRKVTQNPPHSTSLMKTARAMTPVFGDRHVVRQQLPLNFGPGEGNRPEPDIAIVEGTIEDYAAHHPQTAVLVIEISDTTLLYDRTAKAGAYARASIPELWILNLNDRVLEVYRQPAPMSDAEPFGHHYRSITRHTEEEEVTSLVVPLSPVRIADLLP